MHRRTWHRWQGPRAARHTGRHTGRHTARHTARHAARHTAAGCAGANLSAALPGRLQPEESASCKIKNERAHSHGLKNAPTEVGKTPEIRLYEAARMQPR